jgi:hypothetical protein
MGRGPHRSFQTQRRLADASLDIQGRAGPLALRTQNATLRAGPRTQLRFITCADDTKHQRGVLGTENKVLRTRYDGLASVAKYHGRLPLFARTEMTEFAPSGRSS